MALTETDREKLVAHDLRMRKLREEFNVKLRDFIGQVSPSLELLLWSEFVRNRGVIQ